MKKENLNQQLSAIEHNVIQSNLNSSEVIWQDQEVKPFTQDVARNLLRFRIWFIVLFVALILAGVSI